MAKNFSEYALANPISLVTGKNREEFTREDMLKVIEALNIERITFHYTALDGKFKELRIPIANRQQAELVLTEGERVDGSSLFKGIVDAGKSDLYVVPVYKTAFMNPFEEGSLDFVCRFLTSEGELASYTPDNILLKAANLIKENSGLELHALGELEFYLVKEADDILYPSIKQKGYHESLPFIKTSFIVNEMLRLITQITGTVKYAHNEVGCLTGIISDNPELSGKNAEQVEIEFLLNPIEDTADIIALSKWIIRNVAYNYGYIATFVPKLEHGHAGSGMHFHIALMKNGKNVMTDKSGALSKEARQVIGGLCKYAPSLTAFGNMVASSYLRLVPHQEAPTKVCWSECNRSVLIRVPLGWTKVNNLCQVVNPQQKETLNNLPLRQTVELRSPDGSAFPHLLLAGMSLAAEWGLTNKAEALKIAESNYVQVNIHSSAVSHIADLPPSCADSADILIRDRDFYERNDTFTARIVEHIANVLINENDRDMINHLRALSDEERVKESRRIMHKDIHKH